MKKEITKKMRTILNVQLVFMIIVIIFIICSFFIEPLALYREIVLGIVLLMMGYSNHVIYQKKNMTIIYIFFGLLLIVSNIVGLL